MTAEINHQKPKRIFLIEDDFVDVMLFKRVLAQLNILHILNTFTNPEEYLEYLETGNTLPDILFLDLNTPRMNGIDLLKHFSQNKIKVTYPIIVVTTSEDDNDIKEAYRHKADGYILKSISYNSFVENINIVLNYWEVVNIPKGVLNDE